MFPTERQVYHRLRWDPRFDVRRCHVVITLRPSGTQRLPFVELDVEVVPWHRIAEFWIDDELAWSRARRIDRLDELAGRRGAAEPPASEPIAARCYVAGAWTDGAIAARPAPASLRVVTWNLLHDRDDTDLVRSEVRWQEALDRLAAIDADAIALVEATPALWARVLVQPWVRAAATCHGPLEPHGVALVARYPIRDACVLRLPRRRTALAATLVAGDRAIGVIALHLASDRSSDAASARAAQLGAVLAYVAATPRDAWIVMGDFNDDPVAITGGVDAWEATHPGEPGNTFDVAANPLAAATSISGRSRRLDRVVGFGLDPTAARLVGTDGPPPSDHYGVVAELALPVPADLTHAPPTRRTAVAIVPPVELWGAIQRVRCARDRGFGRWPPHVTLAHPFVDDVWLERAVARLRERVSRIEPFELELDRVAPVEPGSPTIAMLPHRRATTALRRLQQAIEPPSEGSFRPHLTIARLGDARSAMDRSVDGWARESPAAGSEYGDGHVPAEASEDGGHVPVEAFDVSGHASAAPRDGHVPAGMSEVGGHVPAETSEDGDHAPAARRDGHVPAETSEDGDHAPAARRDGHVPAETSEGDPTRAGHVADAPATRRADGGRVSMHTSQVARRRVVDADAPPPLSWRVDRIAILRETAGRFAIVEELPLRGVTVEPHATAATVPQLVEIVTDVLARTRPLDPIASVVPFGSIVYAPAHARDVDLAVTTATPPAELAAALGFTAAGSHLRGTIAGRAVELTVSPEPDPGPRDAAYLVEHLCDHGRYGAFLEAWPAVRRFVHARGLAGNGLGFFGSFGWALLLAIPLCHDAAMCASRDVIRDWFAWLAGELRAGASISFMPSPPSRAPLWLGAPALPHRNVARGVTAGTFAALVAEVRRASTADLVDEPPPGSVVAIEGDAASRGGYLGQFRGLLLDIETALGPVVRPWGRFERDDAGGWRHHISVRDRDALPIIARWLAATVPGSHLAEPA